MAQKPKVRSRGTEGGAESGCESPSAAALNRIKKLKCSLNIGASKAFSSSAPKTGIMSLSLKLFRVGTQSKISSHPSSGKDTEQWRRAGGSPGVREGRLPSDVALNYT